MWVYCWSPCSGTHHQSSHLFPLDRSDSSYLLSSVEKDNCYSHIYDSKGIFATRKNISHHPEWTACTINFIAPNTASLSKQWVASVSWSTSETKVDSVFKQIFPVREDTSTMSQEAGKSARGDTFDELCPFGNLPDPKQTSPANKGLSHSNKTHTNSKHYSSIRMTLHVPPSFCSEYSCPREKEIVKYCLHWRWMKRSHSLNTQHVSDVDSISDMRVIVRLKPRDSFAKEHVNVDWESANHHKIKSFCEYRADIRKRSKEKLR